MMGKVVVLRAIGRLARRRYSKPSAKTLEMLEEIQLVRSLQAMEDLLDKFETKALPERQRSEPLKFVRERLRQAGDCSEDIHDTLERRLRGVLETGPLWTEYLLELGYLLVDRGRHEDAQKIFEQAGRGKRHMNSPSTSMDSRAVAFVESGRLLAAQGQFEEAADMYAEAQYYDSENGTYNLECGLALWQLGKGREAARQFFFSMRYDPVPSSMPKVARDAAALEFPHLLPGLKRGRPYQVDSAKETEISSNLNS